MTLEVVGIDQKVIKMITCRNCAAIIKYTDSDTKTKTVIDYSGGSDTYRFFTCPKCSDTVYVPL